MKSTDGCINDRKDKLEHLFSPIKIKTIEVKNRIFMPPMDTGYATIGGEITDRQIAYYVERGKGGVGFINVEFTYVTPSGKIYEHMTGLHHDDMIPGCKKLVDAVHGSGAKIAIQLSHGGRRTHSKVTGEIPVAPSPIPGLNGEVPRELSIAEIQGLIEAFSRAALRARKAGFDAVMIHMAHGYLINQFLSPLSNKRQDRYGGDLEGRSRFAVEILRKIKEEVGQDYPVTCRLCGDEHLPGGFDLHQSQLVARKLEENGIDAIDVSTGPHDSIYVGSAPSYIEPGFLTHLSKGIKSAVGIPVGIVGRINDPVLAEQILAEGKADFISMGRSLIADPELPSKAFGGRLEEIRPCTACNLGCIERMNLQLDISCQTNPMVGREIEFKIAPASHKKKVLIIGGGPAGLETARVAALRGHEVFLYEKENRLGGQLNLACVPPGKAEYSKLLKYYENQIKKLRVSVFHQEATREEIQRIAPEVIVVATGGKARIEPSIRMSSDSLLMAWDVLRGGKIEGEKVVIIGGGQVGCEVADFLLGQGKKITILEMREKVAADMQARARKILLDQLIRGGVEILAQALVTDILESEIRYESGGLKQRMKNIDQIILALGTASERTLLDGMGEIGVPVFSIGDCVKPRKAIEAIREGFDLALEI